MNDQLRQMVIERLQRGEELPAEWGRFLFPPERREYELVYHGKEREEDVLAETMAVPLQPVRTFGGPADWEGTAWRNLLILGDNLQVMKTLLEMKRRGELVNADGMPGIRLVYIDPPFATRQDFQGGQGEKAYQDKIAGARFIEFLRKRLILIRELLASDGSVYIHLDWRKAHYIRTILDEVFGESRFISEIVWQRHDPHNDAVTRYGRIHDLIFWYGRSERPIYNYRDITEGLSTAALREYSLVELADGTVVDWNEPEPPPGARHVILDDGSTKLELVDGTVITWEEPELPQGARRFKLDDCTVKGHNPQRKFTWRGARPPAKRQWPVDSPEEMDALVAAGIYYLRNPERGAQRCRKSYLDRREAEGQLAQDIWLNLGRMKGGSSYPTEKPEALLERIVRASSNPGDLVLDAFAGSGTVLAVAEKLARNWIGIDCGKLSIYTIQKRMLELRSEIGKGGSPVALRPFTLSNAGLYDFSKLRQLPWPDWRFFALQLFECRDEPHTINGFRFDGKRRGGSVLVFNHQANPGKRIDEETVEDIHIAVGRQVGSHVYIIAPRNVFDFQQDYIDLDDVRYYALRIPYSFINELHYRGFTALRQPDDESSVNDTVDSVGFDFIQPPQVSWTAGIGYGRGPLLREAFLQIDEFKSRTRLRGENTYGGLETLSMVMFDFDYDGDLFALDEVIYRDRLANQGWRATFPIERLGTQVMAVFLDVYGNEAREVIPNTRFTESAVAALLRE
jgi:site-specific DNA-methyltransferase (adenine-specific)/adenine-specific DNA-methyltransferase